MNSKKRFVVCVKHDEHETDRDLRKVYEVVPDPKSEKLGRLRIVEESGEDYLYPQNFFLPVALPKTVARALAKAS